MILEILHRLASRPWVYDQIQTVAGSQKVIKRLSRHITTLDPKVVLDIGGGTGALRNLFAEDCRYICLDVEMPKLQRFRSKTVGALAVLGDATSTPIRDGCADVVICKAVTHHLTDLMLEQALGESLRVLKPGGHMMLFDAVYNRERWAGRVLWRLDRGSYPRSADELREKLERKFKVIHWEKYSIYHEYVFGIGVRS